MCLKQNWLVLINNKSLFHKNINNFVQNTFLNAVLFLFKKYLQESSSLTIKTWF